MHRRQVSMVSGSEFRLAIARIVHNFTLSSAQYMFVLIKCVHLTRKCKPAGKCDATKLPLEIRKTQRSCLYNAISVYAVNGKCMHLPITTI